MTPRRPSSFANAWLNFEGRISERLGSAFNVVAQSARLTTFSFALALTTGVLLFFLYDVTAPYPSVAGLVANPIGSWLHSLHHYSSRAFLLFALVHATRLFIAVRFRGPRWTSWQSGIAQVLIAWFVGITGYFLVWDQQAYYLANAFVRLIDGTPVFVQPLALSFLTAETLRDNLFFITLYLHLSVPVASLVLLFIHVSRVRRPQFWPARPMLFAGLTLIGLASAILPARIDAPADLSRLPFDVALDPWFSLGAIPALLLPPAVFLGLLGLVTVVGLAAPWIGAPRTRGSAVVDVDICNECNLCTYDCPYGAITMVPLATLGLPERKKVEKVAQVDPGRCVGCGICIGSCTDGGISLGTLSLKALKERTGQGPGVGGQGSGAGVNRTDSTDRTDRITAASGVQPSTFNIQPSTPLPPFILACRQPRPDALPPGARLFEVPCVGAVNRNLVSTIVSRGRPVIVAACPEELCRFREGSKWTRLRAGKLRKPSWLPRASSQAMVAMVVPGDEAGLRAAIASFSDRLAGKSDATKPTARPQRIALGGAIVLGLVLALTPEIPLANPPAGESALKIAVRTEAPLVELRGLSPEEAARRLPHMRGGEGFLVSRTRVALHLVATVDGRQVLDERLTPRGVQQDGPTYLFRELRLPAGDHQVAIRLASLDQAVPFDQSWSGTVRTTAGGIGIVAYGALGDGFIAR